MSTEMITTEAAEAIQSLPRDLAIVKIENDQIFSLAKAMPRNMETIKEDLAAMIYNFPQFADEAIYEKPVGKDESGVMKYARGLSVRAAETLAECYGFNRIHTDIESLPDGRVKIYASFTDYQRGRTWEDSTIVSPFYRSRNGSMSRHPEDRFLNVIVKSEKSKLVREVINRSVNQALKAWFENECEKQLSKTLDEKAIGKIVDEFKAFGMGLEQIEQIVGRPAAMGWTTQDKIRLIGVWNALKSGETTVAELLDQEPQQPKKPAAAAGTVEGLKNPKGKTEDRPGKTEEQQAPPNNGEESQVATETAEPKTETARAQSELTRLIGLVVQAKKIQDVEFFESRAAEFGDEGKKLIEACLKRKEEIRASRGEKSNGGKLPGTE